MPLELRELVLGVGVSHVAPLTVIGANVKWAVASAARETTKAAPRLNLMRDDLSLADRRSSIQTNPGIAAEPTPRATTAVL